MTDHRPLPHEALRRLRRPLALTRIGMAAERALRAFWPFATVLMASLAALMLGAVEALPLEAAWGVVVVGAFALVYTLWRALRVFRWPSAAEALERLDGTLPGRPITAVTDAQAVGADDAASVAVWRAHVRRMAERVRRARAPRPDLRIARLDPYALRYAALVALVMALLFGSVWRVSGVGEMVQGAPGQDLAGGPVWEGWVEPLPYTGRPSLYLNDIPSGAFEVPRGSRISLRLYGEIGVLSVTETVSGEGTPSSEPAQEFEVTRAGTLLIEGADGAEWRIAVSPDAPPSVRLDGAGARTASGDLEQPFAATDDYGVIGGAAEIALDLAAVDRRHGLVAEPEARDPIVLDLPTDFTGDGTDFTETLFGEFAEHPWAGLPVILTLTVNDAAGQQGSSEPENLLLPERRFFDPLAASVAEQRRGLLWTRENARRVAQILRAVSYHPEDVFRSETAYLRLRIITRRLENYTRFEQLTVERQDEIAAALWDLALLLEEGDLNDALERLRRAQDRLAEAIENGASDEEIAELMQELRDAMQDYMRQLAEQSEGQEQEFAEGEMQEMTGQQLEDMLQRLQELMEQGRMEEAQRLLDQLRQMMENMQIARGQGQQGQSPGEQAMQGLAETLRQQQELNDETFDDLQEQFDQGQPGQQGQQPGQRQGQQGQGQQGQGQGQGQGQQPGQQGQGQGQQEGQQGQGQGPGSQPGDLGRSLAERQGALRNELGRQQGNLPGAGTPEGDAAREALDRAGRAMDGAEDALREDDYAGALDNQAEAMEALREGMRNLGEAMAQQQNGQGQEGEGFGTADGQQRDPLGRLPGSQGRIGTDEQLLQGEDVYRRARELLDEIRRRSGEQGRPDEELDYLRRLLERF